MRGDTVAFKLQIVKNNQFYYSSIITFSNIIKQFLKKGKKEKREGKKKVNIFYFK